MALPAEQLMLVDSAGRAVEVDALIERLRDEPQRVLADDEVGVVVYVGDLGIYSLKPTESGAFLAQPVTEISRPRFSTRVLRRQIGATVLSVTADAVFVVRDGNALKKVRAEKLEPGMILASGEKVYR
jgi:cytochrome P450